MERDHNRPAGFTEHSGLYYFGIYVDPDPYRGRGRLEVNNTRARKSERNQGVADQRKTERKLGLHRQITDVERAILRDRRQERLAGVTLYVRDALPSHSKGLIPEVIDCA